MKNILSGVIMLLFISLQANGQQSQDTLYLKNGYKAIGKLLWQSKRECSFQTSEGLYFTFSADEVERIVTTREMIIGKVDPYTLNVEQLDLYMNKAAKMRNTGRALTLSGAGIMAAGFVTGVIMLDNAKPHGPPEDPHGSWAGAFVIGLTGLVGITDIIIGVPVWVVGGRRKTKAEISLRKFIVAPENSMALGLGMTIRF
jgi:hypothetical protein